MICAVYVKHSNYEQCRGNFQNIPQRMSLAEVLRSMEEVYNTIAGVTAYLGPFSNFHEFL